MLFERVVACSVEVSSTSSRTAKVAALAALLRQLGPREVAPAVGFLSGIARQGRIGLGWASAAAFQPAKASSPSLTIDDIDQAMTEIQATTGTGSAARRAAMITRITDLATPEEASFITRLLVGELRQGALGGLMIDAIAKASEMNIDLVRRAWMLSGDLNETARVALVEGEAGLSAIGLRLFTPVHPMLASGAEDPADALGGFTQASVEAKLDGIRIQVHLSDDEVRVYTRNLNDITDRVPDVVEVTRAMPSASFILDGELMGSGPHFFDCIYNDGDDLIDLALSERLKVLDQIAHDQRVASIVTDDSDVAARYLEDALKQGYEGIVVKDLASTYLAGRRGKSWRKVKKAKTFDLVVLGAEWGSGRRHGWLSNLHLGARTEDGGFVMVGKTFKGLTDELLKWQTEKFKELETHSEGHTVFVRPELVVEIALDGVMESKRYPGGVGLRFARVIRYREDKDPSEADTLESLRATMLSQ